MKVYPINVGEALRDLLKDYGVSLEDILDVMDEERKGVMEALMERVALTERECRLLESNLTSRQLNLLLFTLQTFYITNASGMYKGRLLMPLREHVVGVDGRVTFEGLQLIIKALGIRPYWLSWTPS